MPVESNGYISALNVSYPDGSVDAVNTLDNYMRTFKYAVLYSSTATNSEVIAWWDYGSSLTLGLAESLTVQFNGTNPGTIHTLA